MKTAIKIAATMVALVLLMLINPSPVRAEGNCGFMCQIFGWDAKTVERTQIKEDAATDRARIEGDQALEEIRLQNERLAEESRIQNTHNETLQEINRQADVAIANAQRDETLAQARKDEYIAQVNAWRDAQKHALQMDTDKAIAAINQATQIGLASIHEVGETKRWSMTTELIFSVVFIVAILLIGLYLIRRTSNPRHVTVIGGPQHFGALPPGYMAELPNRSQLPKRGKNEQQEIIYYEQTK